MKKKDVVENPRAGGKLHRDPESNAWQPQTSLKAAVTKFKLLVIRTGNVFISRRYFWVLQVDLLIQCIDSLALSNKNKKGKGNFFNIYRKIELKVKHYRFVQKYYLYYILR